MKYLALVFLMLSSQAFACWNMKANLSVNGSEVKIDQKINHDQVYSFAKDKYIFNVKIPSTQNLPTNILVTKGAYMVFVDVMEKEELNLKKIANGQIVAKYGKEVTMTKEDSETKVLTTMKIIVTEI
jgi:hypothetical protein